MNETQAQATAALAFLDELESQEARLIVWGLTDGFLAEHELLELADSFLERWEDGSSDPPFLSGEELVDWLTETSLLWELPGFEGTERKFRSRVAEGVRLMADLRQMFSVARWRTSPSLVADYRFELHPRVFPRRDIPLSKAVDQIGLGQGDAEMLSALFGASDGGAFQLSQFQVEATREVLASLEQESISATLVAAGTASGKSLAFYLPTFLYLGRITKQARHANVLALYPRKELLKDQLRATLQYAQSLEPWFQVRRGRGLSVAPFYSAVPRDADSLLAGHGPQDWTRRTGVGFICPFVVCPVCGTGDMAWSESDLRAGIERLTCIRDGCGGTLDGARIRLTRKSMASQPPDILFTTTEMLNRQLSSHEFRGLFGVGVRGSPRLVLLDEVHTYGGIHGAQVGLLLRRWRFLACARPHFVGLSATIKEGARFLSDLTGVFSNKVRVLEPSLTEVDPEGMEYTLALRGDPVSGTALLSTTIQASMLLSRLMDSPTQPSTSEGAYGTRVFAFTDNLDVTNRLFDGLRDAEGYLARRANNRPTGSLANLRASAHPPRKDRWVHGQAWTICEDIGHDLRDGVRRYVGRTSSQDAGVDRDVSIVVATPSLEVGYDDPNCGAVIQHKAPPDAAGFIQRRGRAGRGRRMRPWTVVVLSDYGRDRLAYQGYERLVDPVVSPRTLPLGNRYVLKIQAVYALIDWLVDNMDVARRLSGWGDLSSGQRGRTRWKLYAEPLKALLVDPEARSRFARYLSDALSIDADTVTAVLWEAPRSVLLEAVPTLLRRLEHNFETYDGEKDVPAGGGSGQPLPEFVPPNLFSDLNLAEVELVLPGDGDEETHMMGLRHALAEFAPGKVSKRFSVVRGDVSHWIPVPESGHEVDLSSFVGSNDLAELGQFGTTTINAEPIDVVSPRRLKLQEVPHDIRDTSNAFLDWCHEIVPLAEGHVLPTPPRSPWSGLLEDIRFFTHNLGAPLEVRRFATQVSAETKFRSGGSSTRVFQFRRLRDGSDTAVALGFSTLADGLAVSLSLPKALHTLVVDDTPLLRGLRTQFFRHLVREDATLQGFTNPFERNWLADIYLSCITFNALEADTSLAESLQRLKAGDAELRLDDVLRVILRAPLAQDDEAPEELRLGRLHQRLAELLHNATCLDRLHQAAEALWGQPTEDWDPWLQRRTAETVGAALIGACDRICDGLEPGDLLVDVGEPVLESANDDEDGLSYPIWITEATPGGTGFVEEVLRSCTEDRQRFFSIVDAELAPSDFEFADLTLRQLLRWLGSPEDPQTDTVRQCADDYRRGRTHAAKSAAVVQLRSELRSRGLPVTQPALASVSLRILRAGSSAETDRFYARLVSEWDAAEDRLGVEIDARVFACVMSADSRFDAGLSLDWDLPPANQRQAWRFDTLLSLLWPRGTALREENSRYYHPFGERPAGDRLVVDLLKKDKVRVVNLDDGWRKRLTEALLENGQAVLRTRRTEGEVLKEALLSLMVTPLDTSTLLLHGEIQGVTIDQEFVSAHLELPEYYS